MNEMGKCTLGALNATCRRLVGSNTPRRRRCHCGRSHANDNNDAMMTKPVAIEGENNSDSTAQQRIHFGLRSSLVIYLVSVYQSLVRAALLAMAHRAIFGSIDPATF